MTKAVWMLHAKKADFNGLAARFHISPITARIIRNRDITDIDEFDKYLNGSLKDLYEPRLLPDMEKAISILKEKIAAGARIRIEEIMILMVCVLPAFSTKDLAV